MEGLGRKNWALGVQAPPIPLILEPMGLTHIALMLFLLGVPIRGQVDWNPSDRAQCPEEENSAYRWDESRNKCVLKGDVSRGREAFQRCEALETGAQRKECLEKNRDALVGEGALVQKNPLEGHLSTITASVPLTFMVVGAIARRAAQSSVGCVSKKIFKFASVAALGAWAYFRLWAKRKLENMEKEYSKLQEEDPYLMQVAAFKYLEDWHSEAAALARKQRKAYLVFATAYVSSAALAALESAAIFGLTPCTPGPSREGEAQRTPSGQDELGADAPEIPSQAQGGIRQMGNLLEHSPGIAILSGVMTTLYGILAKAAKEDGDNALERAQKVRETRKRFEDMHATAGLCPSRDDLSKPRCYCYTEEGQRHPQRTNSETCKVLWAFHDRDLFAEADNRELAPGEVPARRGCVDKNQRFDARCSCRRRVDEAGNNTCYKAILSPESSSALTSATTEASALSDLEDITAGGLSGGDVALGDIKKKAARASLRLGDILKKQDELALKENHPPVGKVLSSLGAAFKGVSRSLGPRTSPLKLASGKSSLPRNLKAPMESLKREKAVDSGLILRAPSPSRSGPKKSGKKRSPFNESAAQAPKVLGDFMKKDYDYSKSQDDIVDKSEVSLWRIVSARYQDSGLELLFGGQE